MNKHTPGPWKDDSEGTSGDIFSNHGDDALIVATAHRDDLIDAETQFANARLIAAAPEMYGALKKLEELFAIQGDKTFLTLVMSATLKAEGKI